MIGAARIYIHEYLLQQNTQSTHAGLSAADVSTSTKLGFLLNLSQSIYHCIQDVHWCCGAYLPPLSVTHALCIENADCERTT